MDNIKETVFSWDTCKISDYDSRQNFQLWEVAMKDELVVFDSCWEVASQLSLMVWSLVYVAHYRAGSIPKSI